MRGGYTDRNRFLHGFSDYRHKPDGFRVLLKSRGRMLTAQDQECLSNSSKMACQRNLTVGVGTPRLRCPVRNTQNSSVKNSQNKSGRLSQNKSGRLSQNNSVRNTQSNSVRNTQNNSLMATNSIKDFVKLINPCLKQETGKKEVVSVRKMRTDQNVASDKKSVDSRPNSQYVIPSHRSTRTHNSPKQEPYITIEQLSEQINELIAQKLEAARTKVPWVRQAECKSDQELESPIDKQIRERLEWLMSRAESRPEGENFNDNLLEINKKIEILEKLMAESATESEILKNFFHRGRMHHKVHHSRKPYDVYPQQGVSQSADTFNQKKLTVSLQKQSQAKSEFQAPQPGDYPKAAEKKKYVFVHQALPRSTYRCQYLGYGKPPSFSFKQRYPETAPYNSRNKISSSYQDCFKAHKSELIDLRQLDCYRDKFQRLKISYMPQRNNHYTEAGDKDLPLPPNSQHQFKGSKSVGSQPPRCMPLKSQTPHYIKNLQTESSVNYLGKQPLIRSQIQHENLVKLKYNYKKSINV